jgi:hypothetical protein
MTSLANRAAENSSSLGNYIAFVVWSNCLGQLRPKVTKRSEIVLGTEMGGNLIRSVDARRIANP